MLSQWKKGQYLRLQKNPYYWASRQYPMEYVEYDLLPNDNTRLLKVEAGELDVDNGLPYNLIAQVQRSRSALAQINLSTQINYIILNDKISPWNDVHVRQAVNHAMDRTAFVRAILLGHGVPANSFMLKGAIDYDPDIPVPKARLALARKVLRASSHPHGFTMTMELPSGDSVANSIGVILRQELAPLGIKLNLQQVDPTTLFNDQQTAKFHMTTNVWTNDTPDPDEIVTFGVDFSSGNGSLFSFYNNPQMTKLSYQAEGTNDPTARKRLYFKIQELWAHDSPYYALYYAPFVNAVNPHVHGFSELPLGYFNLRGVTKS